MVSNVMALPVGLAQLRMLGVVLDEPRRLEVAVEATWRRLRCPHCGFLCRRVHDRRPKRIRDLEVAGRRLVLVWQRRRFICGMCDSRFLEEHPAFEGSITKRLARRLVEDAKVMPITAVSERHGLCWHLVMRMISTWADLIAEHRRNQRTRVLLVDETSMRKGHRYVTVIVCGTTNKTLAMIPHRNTAALSVFLIQQGRRWCKHVKVVVTDGSPAYRKAISNHLGHAKDVLDRFHVTGWFAAGLTRLRRDVQRREPPGTKPVFDREVFHARFLLLRRGDTLTKEDHHKLARLFARHPRLKLGWQALQELHGLYQAKNHKDALKALDRFCDLYQTGQLPEYHATVNTIINWSDEILAWHHTKHPSNGRIEGTNNLLQVLRRTAHGFTNPTNYQTRALLTT